MKEAPTAEVSPSPTPAAFQGAWVALVGLGYYERLHAGVGYQPGPESLVALIAGSNLGAGDVTTWEAGVSYGHSLWRPADGWDLGLDAKVLYWERSDATYDWKMMSLAGGAYLARDLRPNLALALDGGAALSFALDTTRKQYTHYEYPTRWNWSVCLELRYRFDSW